MPLQFHGFGRNMKRLAAFGLLYLMASLVHFIHNAEFLADYPNLPETWTRADIYGAWAAMTTVGAAGWLLVQRGYRKLGLLLTSVYALLGLASLAHFAAAPMAAHTEAMTLTILLEVSTAALLLIEVLRQAMRSHR